MIAPNEHLLSIHRDAEHMRERAGFVRLDRNERVTPFSASEFRDMLATLTPESFCAYPDPSPLYERLSAALGVPVDHLSLTNGSDAAVRKVFQTFIRPGDRVVLTAPTYAMYEIYGAIFDARCEVVAYDQDRRLDVGRLLGLLETNPRLLALANPDQPTGAVLRPQAIRDLAMAACSRRVLFLVDEAYYPFHPETALPLVREYDNVVVTRTFSKVGGLAGLRLGYLVASPDVVDSITRIRGAHEVNAVAIAVGSYVLDHPEIGDRYLAEVTAGRQVLADAAAGLGLGFPECPTNFQLLELPPGLDPAATVAGLKAKGYLVKGGFSAAAVRQCLRITLAGPAVIAGFVDALRRTLSEAVRT